MLTAKETAKQLFISERQLWRWVKSGYFPAYKVGKRTRFKEEDVANNLEPKKVEVKKK